MGSIKKRPGLKGVSYQVEIRIKGHPNITKTFKTLEEAKVWEQKTEAFIKNKKEFPKLKFSNFIERYIIEVFPTLNTKYRNSLKFYLKFWKDCLGNLYATEISFLQIEEIANKLYEKELSPETRRKYLLALSSVFNAACKFWKWCAHNPVSGVDTHQNLIKISQKKQLDRKLNIYSEFKDFKLCLKNAVENKIKEKNITIQKLMDDLEISKSMYQNFKDPFKNCTIGIICKICKYLEIKLTID